MDVQTNLENYVGIVPFRSGSKGLPNKHKLKIINKSLGLWTVDQSCRFFPQTIVSTDYKCEDLGIETNNITLNQRPSYLATDNARMNDVILYLIQHYSLETKTLVLLQATSPLRTDEDISSAITTYSTGSYTSVTTVRQVPNSFLKNCLVNDGYLRPIENSKYFNENRQSLPETFAPVGSVFVFKAQHFLEHNKIPTDHMGYVQINNERSIDIDDYASYETAHKYVINNREIYEFKDK